jgi:hypothetical protein
MVLQVFQAGSPDTLADATECAYDANDSIGIGYSTDAGVSVVCTPGVNYYIRVASRAAGVDGAFSLVHQPYQVMSLSGCSNCPPKFGSGGCLETLVGTVTIANPMVNQQTSFGSVPAGYYQIRYCHGAFYARVLPGFYDGNTVTNPIGYFVANQQIFTNTNVEGAQPGIFPQTFFIYNNPAQGTSWGALAFSNIPLENTGCVAGPLNQGASLSTPATFNPAATWTGGITAYSQCANLINITHSQAETWARCGSVLMAHLGGPVYLQYMTFDGLNYLGLWVEISGSVTWGLYQVTPAFTAGGFTIVETDTTTASGGNDYNDGFNPVTPGPNLTAAQFIINNLGELAYNNVTATLTGVPSPSAPQVINIPLGSTTVQFDFETPTTAVTAVLTFTDAIGETFPTLSYNATEFLIINTPTATAEPTCPTSITMFTFPIKNLGTLASASGTRVDIKWMGSELGGVGSSTDPGNVLGAGCTTTGQGMAKTMMLGAIAAGATANAFIECENQPSGTISEWQIALSGSGLGNVPPIYYFTYTWP